jgi:penicillin-binding protein activator
MKDALRLVSVLAAGMFFAACPAHPGGPEVYRIAVDEEVRIGDQWSDTDSALVTREMVEDLLSRTWLDEWLEETGGKPRCVVGRIINKSHEHIPVDTFIKDLERELINSGDVAFLASFSQRDQLTAEKHYQAGAASLESQKAMGREAGADFLLLGQINSIVNHGGGQTLKFYQVELELINIETGIKVWMGQKKIKKVIERAEWDL